MLFNKNNQGSSEIYELTGTFHAATDFKSIQADVAAAEMEVSDLIGEDIMKQAQKAYDTDSNKELLDAVRLPVACLAVAYYARKSGLSVGETGRKLKVDENEKVPFEWMIDRDNLEMKERYYRAIDLLFRYLDRENIQTSAPRIQLTVIKTVQDFETVYPIRGSRYTFHMMKPLLLEAENSLKKKISADQISIELLPSCRRYVVLTALVTALQRWSLSVFPIEVARQFSPSSEGNRETKPASIEEINWCVKQFEKAAENALQEARTLLGNAPQGDSMPHNDRKHKFFTA